MRLSRVGTASLAAVVVGTITYQWMRNDALMFERTLTWGGWFALSVFFYVVWGVVERQLRHSPTATADDLFEQLRLLMERSPGAWQWARLAAVAYGSAVANLWLVNQIQFSTAVPWLIGIAVATNFLAATAFWWIDPTRSEA